VRKEKGEKMAAVKPANSVKSDKKRDLILGEFDRVIDSTIAYLEDKIAERFSGILGKVLRKIASELFGWFLKMGGKERGLKTFEYIVDRAFEVDDGNLDGVIDAGFEKYLKHNDVWLITHRTHPAAARLEAILKDEFKKRVIIYTHFVHGKGDTYPEMVRNAFPEKKKLLDMIDEQFEATWKIINLVNDEKGLIKVPSALKSPALKIARTCLEVMEEKIKKDTEAIYA